jgi:hypothetical protein
MSTDLPQPPHALEILDVGERGLARTLVGLDVMAHGR